MQLCSDLHLTEAETLVEPEIGLFVPFDHITLQLVVAVSRQLGSLVQIRTTTTPDQVRRNVTPQLLEELGPCWIVRV